MPLTLAAGVEISPLADGAFEVGLGEVFFKLDEPAALILTLFDGQREVPAVQAEARRRGMPVSEASVAALARGLGEQGLLVDAANLPAVVLPEGNIHCTGCGRCCHLVIGPLDADDVDRLSGLDWAAHGLQRPDPWIRTDPQDGSVYMAQGPDDACVFLDPDNLCRIHKLFGEAAKPDPCRMFPLAPVLRAGQVRVGLTYEGRGLEQAAQLGTSAADEAVRLDDVVRRSLRGYTVLPEVDPGRVLWNAVASASDPPTALQALADAVAQRCPPGELDFDGLLTDLVDLAAESRDHAPTAYLRADQDHAHAALQLLRDRAPTLEGPSDSALMGYLRAQVFIGEPFGRLGYAAGVALLAVTVALARRMPMGLAGAVGGLRCVERVDNIPGAGARLVREAVAIAVAP